MKTASRLVGRYALLWLAFASVFFVNWMQATFGEVTLGQIVFHWRYLGSTGTIAKVSANELVLQCIVWPVVGAAISLWVERRILFSLMALIAAKRRAGLSRSIAVIPAAVILGSTALLAWRTSTVQFVWPATDKGYFALHYAPPVVAKPVTAKPRNLVMIYVESLEAAYGRSDVFGRDLLAHLSKLQPLAFEAYEQLPGTGYTIAAIVSTQCGVPLQTIGFLDWRKQGEQAQQFLPRATCLSDLLSAQGYRNVFMGGAALEFSGKGKFLTQHRFDEAYGRVEWLKLGTPKTRMSGWGLHDDDLFEQAKAKLRQLHEAGQPFNLTLLTVDSHWPAGYLSPACRERGAKGLDQVVECTAYMVADLIAFVRSSGYDADTNVVVIGDHLSPPNSLSEPLAKVGKRTIYNAFFARELPRPNRTTVVHFDMLPTVLDFIGLHPEGGRAGLGFSAFGPPPVPFPTARSRAELGDHTLTPSKAYLDLWEPARLPAPAALAP